MSYRFKRREPLARGFVRIAREELEGAISDLADGSDAGVHQARRRTKKLRALLRLMRPALGEETFSREQTAVRDAARGLSAARDAAVQLATLDSLLDACAARDAEATAQLRCRLAAPSGRSAAAPRAAVIARLQALLDGLEAQAPATDEKSLLRDALSRAYRRVRRAFAEAQAASSAETLHAWRKRVKLLQHQLQLMRRAAPRLCGRLLRQLDRLAEALGTDHDLAVLAADLPDDPALAGLSRELGARRQKLQRTAFRLGRELFAEKPSAWLKPLARAWQRWHEPR